MTTTLDKVVSAIEAFYAPTTAAEVRRESGKFLEKFQNTVEAWNISVELLLNASASESESASSPTAALLVLFAAQTLKHKLVYDWRQLDEPAIIGLRERLWSMLLPRARVPRNVAVQLRLALAALIVQIDASVWNDPVADLFRCSGSDNNVNVDDVLQLLTLIPEQLKNPAIRFPSTDAYYDRCERLLEKHIDVVIQMLLARLGGNLEESQMALTCLLSWIRYGGNGSRLIESAEFLQGIFVLLKRAISQVCSDDDEGEELHGLVETCSELLIELCERLSGRLEDDYDLDGDGGSASGSGARGGQAWYDRLNATWLPVLAREASTLPLEAVLTSRGGAVSLQRPLVTLLAESAQIFIDQLMHGFPDEFAQICRMLLAVVQSQTCPIATAELTFPFFSLLPSFLPSWIDSGEADETAAGAAACYRPIYAALLQSLLTRHLPFPVTCTPEESDRFRELRHVIGDTLKDCVRVLGATEALSLLVPVLTADTDADAVSWQGREAGLFALRTISSAVDPRESEAMPAISAQLNRLLARLLSTPPQAIGAVRKPVSAVLLNVGCYADWLRYHAEHLPGHLQLIGESLKYALAIAERPADCWLESPQSIVSAACQSLKYVAQSVAGLLGRHYGALEEMYLTLTLNSAARPLLGCREQMDLTEAICLALVRRSDFAAGSSSSSSGDDEFLAALERVLQPIWAEARWDAYAVALESLLLPELPRTPLIFSRLLLPSLPQLLAALPACGDDEERLEAWLRCLTAALNNGTPGAVEEMIRVVLLPWLRVVGVSVAHPGQEARIYGLLATIIAGRFLEANDEELFTVSCARLILPFQQVQQINLQHQHQQLQLQLQLQLQHESWCSERFNLLRVLLLHYPSCEPGPLLERSGTWLMLQQFLSPGRPCSAAEIAALTGFLAALLASAKCRDQLGWVLAAMTERVLKDWPLQHGYDLATLLCRAARLDALPLLPLMQESLARILPPDQSTPTEMKALGDDFAAAVEEAKRGGRGRRMRAVVADFSELARRRT